MDPPDLHIRTPDPPNAAEAVLDDQERNRLLFLELPPSYSISQVSHEAYQPDLRQDRRSSKLPMLLGLWEHVLVEGIRNSNIKQVGFPIGSLARGLLGEVLAFTLRTKY